MVILGVWEAPGAPETVQKGGGEAPGPSERATEAPGTAQSPKRTDSRSLKNFKFPPKVQRSPLNQQSATRKAMRPTKAFWAAMYGEPFPSKSFRRKSNETECSPRQNKPLCAPGCYLVRNQRLRLEKANSRGSSAPDSRVVEKHRYFAPTLLVQSFL